MIKFSTETCITRAQRLAPYFTIIKPEGEGPFPVAILMHGCGNQIGPQTDYAHAAAKQGIASVIVDSYSPRKISLLEARGLVCGGMRFWGRERAGDLLATLAWVRIQDWAQPDAIGAAGWSHGGWTVMDALALGSKVANYANLSDMPEDPLAGLKTAFLVYPWCGYGVQTHANGWVKPVPAMMLLGSKDSVSGAVETIVYRDATHSFDETTSINPSFRYNEDYTQNAMTTFADWMAQHLAA
jgi:dienelactone hydrolase